MSSIEPCSAIFVDSILNLMEEIKCVVREKHEFDGRDKSTLKSDVPLYAISRLLHNNLKIMFLNGIFLFFHECNWFCWDFDVII